MLTVYAALGLTYRSIAWHLAGRRTGTVTLPLALVRTGASRASATGIARLNRRARSNAAGFGAGLALSAASAVAANTIDTETERALGIVRALGTRGPGRRAARSGGRIQLRARTTCAACAYERSIHC
jgi:hypothetical protein